MVIPSGASRSIKTERSLGRRFFRVAKCISPRGAEKGDAIEDALPGLGRKKTCGSAMGGVGDGMMIFPSAAAVGILGRTPKTTPVTTHPEIGAMDDFLSVGQVAAVIGQRSTGVEIGQIVYRKFADQCPLVGGRRRVPKTLLPAIIQAVAQRREMARDPETTQKRRAAKAAKDKAQREEFRRKIDEDAAYFKERRRQQEMAAESRWHRKLEKLFSASASSR
jgi:hypothetical protein